MKEKNTKKKIKQTYLNQSRLKNNNQVWPFSKLNANTEIKCNYEPLLFIFSNIFQITKINNIISSQLSIYNSEPFAPQYKKYYLINLSVNLPDII
jgi:hypothetical protein